MSIVLSKGFISVDARRAVAKLREHLLVDLHAYLLELVRAAVLTEAERVALNHDADDLFVRFAPAPCAPDEAAHLLDFALAYDDDAHGRCLRLLAIGVNAALGLRPWFVDLYLSSDGSAPTRFRFDPAKLVEPDEDDPLCDREEGALPPDGQGVDGICIHVRRRPGWDTFKRAVTRASPPEVELLRLTTYELPIAILLHGKPMERPPRPRALVRFAEQNPWRVQVELLAGDALSHMAFLESGVRLAAHALHPWPDKQQGLVGIPVRAVIDAPDLPTNVSRSAVRLEDESVASATRTLERALWTCVIGLASYVSTGDPRDAEIVDPDAGGHREALGRIVGLMLRAARNDDRQARRARELFSLPLFRSATGESLKPEQLLACLAEHLELQVLRQDEPLAGHGAPIVRHAVWVHQPWVEAVLAYLPNRDLAPVLPQLHAGVRRRRVLLNAPAVEPTVPRGAGELAHTSFHVEDGKSAGLRGEMAIRDPSRHSHAMMHVFVEGRLLETVTLPEESVGIPVEVAIEWPGHLVPALAYDAVERSRAFRRVVSRIGKQAVSMVAQLWKRVEEEPPDALRRLVVLAFSTHAVFAKQCGLALAPVLRTTDDRWICATELVGLRRPIRTVASSSYDGSWKSVDGVPVLVLDPDANAVARLLEANEVNVVRYEGCLEAVAHHSAPRTRKALEDALRAELAERGVKDPKLLWFDSKLYRGYIAASPVRLALRHHVGKLIAQSPRPLGIGVTAVAIDEDYMVPSEDGRSVVWPRAMLSMEKVDQKYCQVMCREVEERLDANPGWNLPKYVREYFRVAATDLSRSPDYAVENRTLLDRVRRIEKAADSRIVQKIKLPPPPPRKPTGKELPVPRSLFGAPSLVLEELLELPPPPELPPPTPLEGTPQVEPFEIRPPVERQVDPLEAALQAALRRFPSVEGQIVWTKSGPPLYFNHATRQLRIRRNDPTWVMLQESRDDLDVQAAVTAAALTEINRAMTSVTDAEERRALVELLGG